MFFVAANGRRHNILPSPLARFSPYQGAGRRQPPGAKKVKRPVTKDLDFVVPDGEGGVTIAQVVSVEIHDNITVGEIRTMVEAQLLDILDDNDEIVILTSKNDLIRDSPGNNGKRW